VQNLESGRNYWLAYKALNRAGWSDLGPIFVLTTGRLPMPPFQTPVQISVSDTHITFGWDSTDDIGGAAKLDGYKVYIDGNMIEEVSPSTLSYTYT
jgi:hypothetical protein